MKSYYTKIVKGGKKVEITLKALRASKNLTQEDIAKKLDISVETWRNYEKGKSFPNVLTIKKIETFFKVPYSEIIFFAKQYDKS